MTRSVRRIAAPVAGAIAVLLLALPGLAYPRPGRTERASVGESGSQGNFNSHGASISADGRDVVFESISNTLVPGDMNVASDIFLRDRHERRLRIVSLTNDGSPANGRSHSPSISADGRYVAFESLATNLVPGDTNGSWDVFVRDLVENTTERVSVSTEGAEHDGPSGSFNDGNPSLSADGRYVVFSSRASNLVDNDLNNVRDVFLRDRVAGTTERVSVSESGIEGDAESQNSHSAVSADGRYVAFYSQASTLAVVAPEIFYQIFRKDRVTGAVELVSVSNDGGPANSDSFSPSISQDGRAIVFSSFADNLVPNDGTVHGDVFLRDVAEGITQRISVSTSGHAANDASEHGAISPDGRYISFSSWATNLSDEKDGRWSDVFVHDRLTGETQQASLSNDGLSVPLGGRAGVMSNGARMVVFQSSASELAPGDTNDRGDIYTRDRGPAIGIVDRPHASVVADQIEVTGDAVFSGVLGSSAEDASDDGGLAAATAGTELLSADIVFRPEAEDLGIVLRLHRVEGPAAPDSQTNVYGMSFEVDGARYEIRSAREGEDPHARHLLFLCAPVCEQVAELQGSVGETGDEVRVSLPLETIDAHGGDALSGIRAFSGQGTTSSGVTVEHDSVTVGQATVPTSRVQVGVVPAGTDESEVIYQVDADVDEGHFSAELPRIWAPGDYDVWARACLDDACGAASVPLTLEEGGSSPTPSSSPSSTASPSASSSPSPRPSGSSTPDPNPLCPPGRRCETWAAQYQTANDGVGYPRGMSISPDDGTVYLIGDYGPSFFVKDLHTVALDAQTGERLWVATYNGPMNESETAWTSAASSELVFAGGESPGDSGWGDFFVVAYDAEAGSERWTFRRRGPFNGINAAKVMTVSHDENVLFVSGRMSLNGQSGDFATFAVDADTGEQLWFSSYNGTLPDYDDPQGITLSPDGSRLFVTGHSWGRNTSFDYATVAYDAATGQQLWVARYDADFDRELAAGVVASPDGKRVYVGGSGIFESEDYATVAYDAATGEQLWANSYDGGGLDDRAADIAMDPLGEFVIVTGKSRTEDTDYDMATVAYDAVTGEQRWVRRFHGPSLDGSDWGTALQISPQGTHTFVTGVAEVPHPGPGFDEDALTVAYDTSTGATIWEAFYNSPANDTEDPFNLVMSSDGSWVYPGGLLMHSDNLGFSSLAQYFAVGYETGVSEPTPTQSPSSSPTPTGSPTPTPTPTGSATPTASPSPTSTATPSPTPDPTQSPATFTTSGTIDVSNPASAFVGGVTENEFAVTCAVPQQTQGLDGYVVEIPEQFGTGSGTAAVVGPSRGGDVELYDLDLAFYTADCRFISQSATAEPDEVADVPESTRFIVVNASLGVDTSFVLTVTGSPAPSTSPSTEPTSEPTPPGGERGVYPLTPKDPYFARGGEGESDDEALAEQWGPKMIQAPQAWQLPRATGHRVNVAVIDSGLDLDHPDFACPGKLGDGAVIINGNVTRGAGAQDIDGHGTHVAGIIGACTNNGIGTAGVAPDAKIIPYRVFTTEDEEAGAVEDIAVAIKQAADDGAHVINMSLGIGIGGLPITGAIGYQPGLFPEIDDAIEHAQEAGVVVVAAAGNSAALPLCEYPAIYEDVLCVGATDPRDVRTWYSTFPNKPDNDDDLGPAVVAPGGTETLVFCDFYSENILSTYARDLDDNSCDGLQIGYDTVNGTSMASPHVAGVAALVYDRLGATRSAADATTVIDAITSSAVDLGPPGYDPVYAFGRVDALAAVSAIADPDPSASPTPTTSTSASPTPTATTSASPSPTESPTSEPTGSPRTSPQAPTNLVATTVSDSRIELSWTDNSATESGFAIERMQDGGPWQEIDTTGPDDTFYLDAGLAPDTTYHYRVRAFNSAGHSDYSNTAAATTAARSSSGGGSPSSAPASPSSLTANAPSSTRIELTWADNSATEDGFAIERRQGGGPFQEIASTGRDQNSYLDANLQPSTTYHYRVRAYNSAGHSFYSNVVSATTAGNPGPDPGPSEAPPTVGPAASGSATTTIAASRARVGFKRGFELSGAVTRDDNCSGPLEVTITRRIHGTDSYAEFASTPVSGRDTWGLRVAARHNASYVAQVRPTDTCEGAASSPTDVLVRAKVKVFRLKRLSRVCSAPQRIEGKVRPNHRGDRVRLQRKLRGGWRTIDVDRLNRSSRFRLIADRCHGKHRIVWPSQDARNLRALKTFRL